MPYFIWTAKDKLGKPIAKEVFAETIEESKAILLAEGCTDLQLKSDEIVSVGRSIRGVSGTKASAKQWIQYLNRPSPTFLNTILGGLVVYLPLTLLIVHLLYRGNRVAAIIAGIALIAWFLFTIWLALPGIYYAKLNKAKDWNRWKEVLKLVSILEKIRNIHAIKIPTKELIRVRAHALAGLGRLQEALGTFQQCENHPETPSWLYKAQIAAIYDIAKEYDKGLEYAWKAIEEKQTPALYLDLVNRLLRYKKDTVQAHNVLAKVDKSLLTDIAKPYYSRCLGILAYLEGDYASARRELEASLKIVEENRNRPFRDGHLNMLKGYLCCVFARQGDLTEAEKYFMQARKYLVATDETELLEECQKAIG